MGKRYSSSFFFFKLQLKVVWSSNFAKFLKNEYRIAFFTRYVTQSYMNWQVFVKITVLECMYVRT